MSKFLRHSGKTGSAIAASAFFATLVSLAVFPASYPKFDAESRKHLHLLAGLTFNGISLISAAAVACSLSGWEDSKLKSTVKKAKYAASAERTKTALEARQEAAIEAIRISSEQSRAGMIAALTGGFSTPTEEQQLTSQILPHIEPVLVQNEMLFDSVFSSQFGYAVRFIPGGMKGQNALLNQDSKEFKTFEVGLRSRLGDLVLLPSGKGSLTAYVFNGQSPITQNPREFICDFQGVVSTARELGSVVQVLGDPLELLEALITSTTANGETVGLAVYNGDQRVINRYQADTRLVECEPTTGVRIATTPDLVLTQIQKKVTTLIVIGQCSAEELAARNRQVIVCDEGKYRANAVIDLRSFPLLTIGYDTFPIFPMAHQVRKQIEQTELKTLFAPEALAGYVDKCAEFVRNRYQQALASNNPKIATTAIDEAIFQLRATPVWSSQSEEMWRSQILSKAGLISATQRA